MAEANAQVGTLDRLFGSVMQMRMHLKGLYRDLDEVGYPPNGDDIPEDMPAEVARDHAMFLAMADVLREQLEAIQATGCVIKDIETGLVDWPALHEDREVWLCWKYGEREVGHWHELHGGLAGRRPISELHQGREPGSPPQA